MPVNVTLKHKNISGCHLLSRKGVCSVLCVKLWAENDKYHTWMPSAVQKGGWSLNFNATYFLSMCVVAANDTANKKQGFVQWCLLVVVGFASNKNWRCCSFNGIHKDSDSTERWVQKDSVHSNLSGLVKLNWNIPSWEVIPKWMVWSGAFNEETAHSQLSSVQ